MQTNEFKDLIKSGTFLVDFYTEWCRPCKIMAKQIESFKDKITIIKIDAEKHADLSDEYSVNAVPTVLFFKDGKVVNRVTGVISDLLLEEAIDKANNG